MAITRINEFEAAAGAAEELNDFLHSLTPYITGSEGCLGCEVLRSTDEPDRFAVIERWASAEAHRASVENFPKDQMQSAMRLFAGPPRSMSYA